MRLIDIALKGMSRRPGRMLLLVIGLAIGVATVVALMAITTSMNQSMADNLDQYGANILIVPRSNDLALSYGGVSVASASYDITEMSLDDLQRIETIHNAANVSVVAPKLLSAVDLGGRQILMAGVQFEHELRLKQWWQVTGAYPEQAHDALVGARLAEELALTPGQAVEVLGQTFQVVGVLADNGSQDDHILFVDLGLAQQVLGQPGRITLAEVAALCTECPIEEMVSQISGVLPQMRVTALRQAVTLRMQTIGQLTRFAMAVSLVVTAIGGLIVLTTMLGAVAERRKEIGLFRALGFGQRHVGRIVLVEAALVSLVGGAVGWLIGMVVAVLVQPAVAGLTDAVRWNPWLALGALGGAILIGVLGSIYPAIRAGRLDPNIALRAL